MRSRLLILLLLAACDNDSAAPMLDAGADAPADAPILPTFVPCQLVDVRHGGAVVTGRCVEECIPPEPTEMPGTCDGRVTLASGERRLFTCFSSRVITPGLPDRACCEQITEDMILTSYYVACGAL